MRVQMRFFTLWFTVLLLVFSSLSFAAEEVSHPYLNSAEYQNGINEIQSLQGKISSNEKEIDSLAQQIARIDLNFYRMYFAILPFVGVDLSLLGLIISSIFIVIYLRYLRKYNPLKWFIMFKSRRNLSLVLNAIRRVSKGILAMMVLTCLLPTGSARGDGLDAVHLSMSTDPLAKTMTLLTCGAMSQEPIDTGLDDVNGLPFYRKVKPGSYEYSYDVLALCQALKISVQPESFVRLLARCPRGELDKVYLVILSIDDSVMLTNIIQQRLMSLIMGSELSDLDKTREIALIYTTSHKLNKLELIKGDLLSVCDASHFTHDRLSLVYLADIALDMDLIKFKALWNAIKNEFPEFAKNRQTRLVFQQLLIKANAKTGLEPLYDNQELLKLIPFLDNNQKVQVAILFSKPLPDLAKSVLESTSFDNLMFMDMNDALEYCGVVKTLVPGKVPALVTRLANMAVYAGGVPFGQIRDLFQPLSMSDDSIIDAMIQVDREIYGDSHEKSKWITAELLQVASPELLRKYLIFLKERYGAYRLILTALHTKDMDSFYQYLDFMYTYHGSDLMNIEFGNNLYAFTAWRQAPMPLLAGDISTLPWNVFLLHYEAGRTTSDAKKLHELLAPIDSILYEYSCDSRVLSNKLPVFLVYYQVTKDSNNPVLQQYNQTLTLVLEKEIKGRLEETRREMAQETQTMDTQIARSKAQLTQKKWDKAKAMARFIALAILLIGQFIYILVGLRLSIKYALHLLIGRTSQRIALFLMIFLETFAKFLLPTLILFPAAVVTIVLVQGFALLCGCGAGFPTITEAVANYNQMNQVKPIRQEHTASAAN